MDADIGIIGIGAMGSMTMWQLIRKGLSVIGFEQFHIGHDRAALGSDAHIFRTIYKEGAKYVPILLDAYDEWLELEKETDTSLLTLTKGLTIGNPGLPSMLQVIESIERYPLDYDILTCGEAKFVFPQHQLLPEEIMVIDKKAGLLHSRDAVKAAVHRSEQLGATVYSHTPIDRIEEVVDGVLLYANGKKYKVGNVVITTGPFIHELVPELADQIDIRQTIGTWFPVKDTKAFYPDQFPVFIKEIGDLSIYGLPSIDGKTANVSLSAQQKDKILGLHEFHDQVRDEHLNEISQFVRTFLPGLDYKPSQVKAYMEAYTKNNTPIIGYLPQYRHVLVATGFSGHGFKMAPAIGKLISQMIMNEKPSYEVELFSLETMTHQQSN